MKPLPSEESKSYGDSTFGLMMMAKVISVQLVNELGYDLLFQDVGEIFFQRYPNVLHLRVHPSTSHKMLHLLYATPSFAK